MAWREMAGYGMEKPMAFVGLKRTRFLDDN
jgi:hypothetical protein